MPRKKALIIGINYTGSDHQLNGCINDAMNVRDFLVQERGFPPPGNGDMIVMTDEPENEGTPFYPTNANILAAFQWLTSRNGPGDTVWLSYSGHGGQVKDLEGERASGLDDTICPIDFETAGQITSDMLHRAIISPMHPEARLTILFDCCHSGSACELPFVYRPDAEGNINLLDTFKKGVGLVKAARGLMEGGLSMDKIDDAKMLLGGATDFFHSLRYGGSMQADDEGLAPENFEENWEAENKDVWMFSGCRDDQTSADTSIAGSATGAMSWAFMRTMREQPDQSYVNVLQNTREALVKEYSQVPQLSCGGRYDLDQSVLL
ncbi:hypothetical protein OQA88_718 [Cercophora sp. LCS_1]